MKKRVIVKIYGRVQGVFFRGSAVRQAEYLGIKGFVRNEPDGSVYIEAEGKERDLNVFLEWCKKGPLLAKVERMEVELEKELKNFSNFEIRYN